MQNLIQTNWHIITGGPSSGKTSLIKKIESLGFKIIHETARAIIEYELKRGKTLNEIRKNDGTFQKKSFRQKLSLRI